MKNDDIYLVHTKHDNLIYIKERDKVDPEDKVLRRINLYPANMNDLVPLNILMDNDDFYYEVYTEEDLDTGEIKFKLKMVGDILLANRYALQAEAILRDIKKKEVKGNDSKTDQ